MKVVLTILGGLCFSVVTFVGGLVAATVFYSAGDDKKQLAATTDLWTNRPVRVDVSNNNLERLPSREAPPEPALATREVPSLQESGRKTAIAASGKTASDIDNVAIDATTTGSISPEDMGTSPEASDQPLLSEAHLEWCSSRYRSYRPRDNSYTPYSGGRRECRSPFSSKPPTPVASANDSTISPLPTEEDSFPEETASGPKPDIETASAGDRPASYGTWEHAKSCFARYRSYRPEDNTYQPFSGGPRRQCH